MKVCDKCRKEMKEGKQIFGFELCEECVNHITAWIKKGKEKGFNLSNIFGEK